MPIRRITFPALVAVMLLLGLVTSPAANAATGARNWLAHACASTTSRNCVVAPLDVDTVGHTLTFHDSRGHHHVARTPAAAWSIAKRHSHHCPNPFASGCYDTDTVTGYRVVVFPDGTAVAVKRYHH